MRRKSLRLLIIVSTVLSLTPIITEGQIKNKNLHSPKEDRCLTCHKEIDNMPSDFSENDVHRHANLACSSCHGGDPNSDDQEIAMSPRNGFIGIPKHKDIPRFCGKCHSDIEYMRAFQPSIATDQVTQYYTSAHGKKLIAGDENVAECASCHTAHSIMPVKDPRSTVYKLNIPGTCNKCHGNSDLMKKYNLSSNMLEEYSNSVHGIALLKNKDLGAPACNDCHGNHGAMPPGITSVSHVCGTCHASNMEYFNTTRMARAFEEQDFHGCEQCHGNHAIEKTTDEMIGTGEKSLCVNCHSSGDAGYVVANKIKNSITDLKTRFETATNKYKEVKQKGMNDVEIGFLLQDAKQDLIQSRTMIHTFDSLKVEERTRNGIQILSKASVLADKEIDEYYTRRTGFAAATAAILIFAVALYFKIKDREKKKSTR